MIQGVIPPDFNVSVPRRMSTRHPSQPTSTKTADELGRQNQIANQINNTRHHGLPVPGSTYAIPTLVCRAETACVRSGERLCYLLERPSWNRDLNYDDPDLVA
jgi:hypothetical protein